jgi:hypothetical protein
VAGRIEDYAIVGDMQSVALNLGGHAEEHRRQPRITWDERRSVPG